jgi:DNA-directed RNA polymerase sigma subunit (sigma70/sigma32)
MNKYLTPMEKGIICKYYGIDEPYDKKVSVAKIAEWANKSEIWVKKKKAEALKKLQNQEVKEIIENFMQE